MYNKSLKLCKFLQNVKSELAADSGVEYDQDDFGDNYYDTAYHKSNYSSAMVSTPHSEPIKILGVDNIMGHSQSALYTRITSGPKAEILSSGCKLSFKIFCYLIAR